MKSRWNLGSMDDITWRIIGGAHLIISSSSACFFSSNAHEWNICSQFSISGELLRKPEDERCLRLVNVPQASTSPPPFLSTGTQAFFSGEQFSLFTCKLSFRFIWIVSPSLRGLSTSLSLLLNERLELGRSSRELLPLAPHVDGGRQ